MLFFLSQAVVFLTCQTSPIYDGFSVKQTYSQFTQLVHVPKLILSLRFLI